MLISLKLADNGNDRTIYNLSLTIKTDMMSVNLVDVFLQTDLVQITMHECYDG